MDKKVVEYVGVKNPQTIQELKVEVLGLRHVMRQAEERIARLEQAVAVAELQAIYKQQAEENKSEQPPAESGTEETNTKAENKD